MYGNLLQLRHILFFKFKINIFIFLFLCCNFSFYIISFLLINFERFPTLFLNVMAAFSAQNPFQGRFWSKHKEKGSENASELFSGKKTDSVF